MTPKRPTPKAKQSAAKRATLRSATERAAKNVYRDMEIWRVKKRGPRKWHPVKKMRYVLFRMIGGKTVTDAVKEIHWDAGEFWSLIDLKHDGPFAEEYQRAKRLQGRAFADSVITIAEGRDSVSRDAKKKLVKIILRGIHRAKVSRKGVSEQHAKVILKALLARINIEGYDSVMIQRNKLQIDAAKYIAKVSNPAEFGDASKLSLGGPLGGSGETPLAPITIQFVGPDGKVVAP